MKIIEKMQSMVDNNIEINMDKYKPEEIMNTKFYIPMEDVQNAIYYLSAVTGIDPLNSGICDMEHGIFRPEYALKNYMEEWKKWYDENKCTMTAKRADSLYKNFAY